MFIVFVCKWMNDFLSKVFIVDIIECLNGVYLCTDDVYIPMNAEAVSFPYLEWFSVIL